MTGGRKFIRGVLGHVAKETEAFIGRAAASSSTTQPFQGQPAAQGSPAFGAAQNVPSPTQPMATAQSNVIVNGVQLGPADMATLQMTVGFVQPGNYWYDRRCGAYGLLGGPCMGAIYPGLGLGGGQLAPDASGRNTTGCFINGRQLHALDVMRLQAMGVMTLPGHWWLDANGSYGMAGNPFPLGNLRLQAMATAPGGRWGGQANSWSTNMGSYGGTDGQGFTYVGETGPNGFSYYSGP